MNIFAKLPKFSGFKKGKTRKMRATVARRPLRATTAAGYEEMDEPNMRLSRALLIVLLLHVVAVSGIIAFNAIKTRQGPVLPRLKSSSVAGTNKTDSSTDAKPGEVRPAQAVDEAGGKDNHHAESHKTYVVAKGDNPVAIAKKFKVSYDELLALNHIDDPRKLKIGQKLLIPNKTVKGKKGKE